jgi:hypothetical protein
MSRAFIRSKLPLVIRHLSNRNYMHSYILSPAPVKITQIFLPVKVLRKIREDQCAGAYRFRRFGEVSLLTGQ